MKFRHKLMSAAVVVPIVMAAPAMADEPIPTDPPVTPVDPVDPVDPTPTDPPVEQPPAQTPAAQIVPVETAPEATVPLPTEPPAPKRIAKRTSRAGVSMRTRGVRYSPTTAVFRLMNWARKGRAGYHNGCLRLADDAYGIRSGRTSTALRQWFRARRAGFGHTNRMAPIGAQLFWRTSNPAGHVATYVGRGLVVTNMPGGRVKMVPWRTLDRWGPYLGWAEPYYGR